MPQSHCSKVNMPYIFWVAAFNTTFILGYLVLDLLFFPSKSVYSPTSKLKVPGAMTGQVGAQAEQERPPSLLEAINRNGLVLFLVVCALFSPILSDEYLSLLGQHSHGVDQSCNPNNLYIRFLGHDGPLCIFDGDMRDSVGSARLQTTTLVVR